MGCPLFRHAHLVSRVVRGVAHVCHGFALAVFTEYWCSMKVKIEIELNSEDELPVATELLSTLKALAAHVETKIKKQDTQTNLQKFSAMIGSVEDDDGKKLEEVATRIQRMFDEQGDEQMLWDFFEAFTAVVLEGDLVCCSCQCRRKMFTGFEGLRHPGTWFDLFPNCMQCDFVVRERLSHKLWFWIDDR